MRVSPENITMFAGNTIVFAADMTVSARDMTVKIGEMAVATTPPGRSRRPSALPPRNKRTSFSVDPSADCEEDCRLIGHVPFSPLHLRGADLLSRASPSAGRVPPGPFHCLHPLFGHEILEVCLVRSEVGEGAVQVGQGRPQVCLCILQVGEGRLQVGVGTHQVCLGRLQVGEDILQVGLDRLQGIRGK